LPIRICHLITDLDTGGAERTLVNLVTALDQTKFSCDVVTLLKPGSMARPLIEADIPVTSLGMLRGQASVGALLTLVRHLHATKPLILQTWLYHADLIGMVAAFICRPKFLLWNVRCTDMTQGESEKPIRWLVRTLALLSRRPHAIIVNSHQGKQDHVGIGYHPRRWINIPNGVDVERFSPRYAERGTMRRRLGLDPNTLTIGLVARDHAMKDVDTFLCAASLFCKSHHQVQFVLCGDGFSADNATLNTRIASLDLKHHVFLLGRRQDMELIYPAFDILTLCSIYGEGFPNVLCEAMACGVPCVATDVGDSARIIADCGVIVPMRTPEALAEGWRTLLERGPGRLGRCARARVTERYDLDRMREQYQALYESLAEPRSA